MTEANNIDYNLITEAPGLLSSREQIERMYQRYKFAADYVENKVVLEIACGTGIGLGLLAKKAKKVVGVDIDEKNIRIAQNTYQNVLNIEVKKMDAHSIDYPDASIEVVLLYEAIYYLKEPLLFIREASRVLKKDGILLICTVNKEWDDFHPSSFTYSYFSMKELDELIKSCFKQNSVYGGYKVNKNGLKNILISVLKRTASHFRLIPKSLKARVYLKRLFFGQLIKLPDTLTENASNYFAPDIIESYKEAKKFKILYTVSTKG